MLIRTGASAIVIVELCAVVVDGVVEPEDCWGIVAFEVARGPVVPDAAFVPVEVAAAPRERTVEECPPVIVCTPARRLLMQLMPPFDVPHLTQQPVLVLEERVALAR